MPDRVVLRPSTAAPGRSAKADLQLTRTQVEAIARETGEPGWWTDLRSKAVDVYRQMPLPDPGDELWRRTDLARLRLEGIELGALSLPGKKSKKLPAGLSHALSAKNLAGQLVFQNGACIQQKVNPENAQAGLIFRPLSQAVREYPELVGKWAGSGLPSAAGKFDALATATADAGFFLYAPKGMRPVAPLHCIFWTDAEALRSWRWIVVVEDGANLELMVEYASPTAPAPAVRAGIAEIFLRENATFRLAELQGWGENVWNYSNAKAVMEARSSLDWVYAHLGSIAMRAGLSLELAGEAAKATVSGLFGAGGNQHFDCNTHQNHLAPHTTSNFLYKGALWNQARAAWRGMVYVAPDANGVDGYQINRNLILSEDARADSLPGLEILSNDVRCSHGATIGQLNPEELYYMQARGIPEADARELLIHGFFDPILDGIPMEAARKRFQVALQEKLATMKETPVQETE